MKKPFIKMTGIAKFFGTVQALSSVDLDIYSSEIHALLGENGAGKSTLMKILSGIHKPSAGLIEIENNQYEYLEHKLASKLGIGIIYQELSVIDELTVLENLFLGRHIINKVFGVNVINWRKMRTKASITLLRIGLKVSLDEKVSNLSISHKQMLEIAKVLMMDAKVIIMDEPTSSLTNKEVEYLFIIMEQLRKDGVCIIYISHKLNEIRRIAQRYTIMKDGVTVDSGMVENVSNDEIIKKMVGRDIQKNFFSEREDSKNAVVAFEVKNISSKDNKTVKNISFTVKKGEILGFAGLVGSGRTEFMNCIFGVMPIKTGEIYLNGEKIVPKNPFFAVKNGMAYITESRRENGFFHNFSISQNMAISKSILDGYLYGSLGIIKGRKENEVAEQQRHLLKLKCRDIHQNITELSGGNQQKVLISKWLCCDPELIIFDEPTRGIDIGAKAEIYKIMRELSDKGKTILMVSSELPEIIAVCDRIAIFCEGELSNVLDNHNTITEEEIMKWAINN